MPTNSDHSHRLTVRVPMELYQQAKYWAERKGYASVNELIIDALEADIERHASDVIGVSLSDQRIGEIVDVVKALTRQVANLEISTQRGLSSLLNTARGDSYLDNIGEDD